MIWAAIRSSEAPAAPRITAARACAARTLVRADVRVDGLPHDRVRELEAFRRLQDREPGQQVGGAGRLVLVDVGQSRRLGEAGAVAEHRDGPHQRSGAGGRSREAQEHRLGHRGWTDATHVDFIARVSRELLLTCLAQQRLEEEGVAAGGLATGGGEVVPDMRTEPCSQRPAVASTLSGAGRSTVVSGAEASRARSATTPSPGRVEARTASGRPSSRGARYARNRIDSASHQCRSSTTSATGPSAVRLLTSQYRPCSIENELSAVGGGSPPPVGAKSGCESGSALEQAVALRIRRLCDRGL